MNFSIALPWVGLLIVESKSTLYMLEGGDVERSSFSARPGILRTWMGVQVFIAITHINGIHCR